MLPLKSATCDKHIDATFKIKRLNNQSAQNKLIVALDVPTVDEARASFRALREVVGMFKIGSQLFTAAGPDFVREIVKTGERVFLDLKFHDIPNTVAAACVEATRLGVSMLNVHASGGGEMMRRAVEAVAEISDKENLQHPTLLAVTVLTSMDQEAIAETGVASNIESQVTALANLAYQSDMNGVVASPHEVRFIRRQFPAREFVIVTPGVRPRHASSDDQRRVMTPAEAIRAGADYLVVGRAILNAKEPLRAAQDIIAEMQQAFADYNNNAIH